MKKFASILLLCIGATTTALTQNKFTTKDYTRALKNVTDVMVNDVTSPVAAARYYAYITLTSNEVTALFKRNEQSLSGIIRGYSKVFVSDSVIERSDESFAVVYSIFKIGERLLPSGFILAKDADSLTSIALKRGIKKEKIDAAAQLVDEVVQQIMEYSRADGFRNLSGYKKYTPLQGDSYWQPTAPAYIQAIEPNWNTVRPFILDSAQQFKPVAPPQYDTAKTSSFCKQLREVYDIGNGLSKVQKEIAMYWDCNPFAVQQIGHVEFGLKKISPGGHWIGITGIACNKEKKGLAQTVYIHTIISITLADAFISCWDEKYRSNVVRPETAIHRLIDKKWRPLLQTPPFPEYTSGHSVISTAAATVLSYIFGSNYYFKDDTETDFGLPTRAFRSFEMAAEEAAISRLYGGIHYKSSVDIGRLQGRSVGKRIIEKVLTGVK
jgi:hypothetical protein